ncbi:hypothetical protein KY284_035725 [Solanum tuberosum]|nr:hypothetical protein KY284_035725 [Solanum tuberosum]
MGVGYGSLYDALGGMWHGSSGWGFGSRHLGVKVVIRVTTPQGEGEGGGSVHWGGGGGGDSVPLGGGGGGGSRHDASRGRGARGTMPRGEVWGASGNDTSR